MSVLRSIETRLESLLEGTFNRVSRQHVHPIEIARKLTKEMDDHKTVSVSRVYAPNEYTVYLSPGDRAQLPPEDALVTEFSDYLAEHARREGYALLSTPRVRIEEDEDLQRSEFGIATRMIQPRGRGAPPEQAPADEPEVVQSDEPQATRIFTPSPETAAVSPDEAERLGLARANAVLVVNGRRHELTRRTSVLGRSRDCDVTIDDPNVSRRHAEVRQENGSYWIVDLESTNGVEVNGSRVRRAELTDGDQIVVGTTEVAFERPF